MIGQTAWAFACVLALGLLVSCGRDTAQEPPTDSVFVALDRPAPIPMLAGRLMVASHSVNNREGILTYSVELKNTTGERFSGRVHGRFFDETYATEYEKVPCVEELSLNGGESKKLEGTLDFRGLPEGRAVKRMGLSVRLGEIRR